MPEKASYQKQDTNDDQGMNGSEGDLQGEPGDDPRENEQYSEYMK